MNPSLAARILVILGGVLIAAAVVFSFFEMRSSTAEVQVARTEFETENNRLAAYQARPASPRVAALPDDPMEETTFYNVLRGWCRAEAVRVSRFDTSPNAPNEGEGEEKLTPREVTVVLEGPYDNVRRVLARVERSPRLLNTMSAQWQKAGKGLTQLSLTIVRYVTPEGTASSL